jgi:PadR family transcriptional regulator AphA
VERIDTTSIRYVYQPQAGPLRDARPAAYARRQVNRDSSELSRGDWAVLALLAERPSHGWALSRELAPSGEIGQVWSGDRQRVYRALRKLDELGLIESTLTEPGEGPHRTVFRPTEPGRRRLAAWLAEPVAQMGEAQSTFVLKLVFTQRAGIDPTTLLVAQRAAVIAALESLAAKLRASGGSQVHLQLRLETTRALLSFIDGLSTATAARTSPPRRAAGKRSRAAASGVPVSDFTGTELNDEDERATVILRYGDRSRGILVASAHVDDPIVGEIADVGREAGAAQG